MTPQNPDKLFPLYITDDLERLRAFYVDRSGWTLSHQSPDYLQVQYRGGPELCFMTTRAAAPLPAYGGQGAVVSVPTPDCDALWEALQKAKLEPLTPPSDKPWGWRSFHIQDPCGVVLDYFHVIDDA